ncbi:plant cysteine oxidase 2-like [Magnolia sinica]|uniref:plant cysteine oxidase 2-like n=1 Tax=Magnolia sinica TaxID=86752 RepID=UPI00265A66B0|nr:plant cysteine oxidase 2-like [Magnolia sinica]XP_058105814.1 plant cysteine oxidase 2-like [Magnolia sinica]
MTKAESSFVDEERDTLRHVEKIIRKKCCRKRKKRCRKRAKRHVPLTVVQKLYNVCRQVFKGPGTVPPPEDVQKLQLILDKMKPEDVGLSSDLLFFKAKSVAKGTPRITCTTIYKCEDFSLCIFFLPSSGVIPLHNHPGMTVFSKLLLGSMHIKAYDWVDLAESDNSAPSSQLRLARLEMDQVFTAPCNASILYPSAGGNIHAFTAVTPCAVLDVFGPPYSKDDGRDCTYYRDLPCSGSLDGAHEAKEGSGSYALLEEIVMPKDLKMDPVEYRGPQIVES